MNSHHQMGLAMDIRKIVGHDSSLSTVAGVQEAIEGAIRFALDDVGCKGKLGKTALKSTVVWAVEQALGFINQQVITINIVNPSEISTDEYNIPLKAHATPEHYADFNIDISFIREYERKDVCIFSINPGQDRLVCLGVG